MNSAYSSQPVYIQTYAGERLTQINGINYFVKNQTLFSIQDNGQQIIAYTHDKDIDCYCFVRSHRVFAFIASQKMYLFSLSSFQVMQSFDIEVNCVKMAISDDLQLLGCVSAYPSPHVHLLRINENNLLALTKSPIDALSQIYFQNEQVDFINRLEFLGNLQMLMILKQQMYLVNVVVVSNFVLLKQHRVFQKFDKQKQFDLALLQNLCDFKTEVEVQSTESQVKDILQQSHNVKIQQMQQQTSKFCVESNLEVQKIMDQIQQPLKNFKQHTFTHTNPRENFKRCLELQSEIQNEFTGEFCVFQNFIIAVCRNFGLLCFSRENPFQSGYLDLQFNEEKDVSDFNVEFLGYKPGFRDEDVQLNKNYSGDRRIISVSCGDVVISHQIQFVCGFQDSCVQYYDVQVEQGTVDRYEEYPIKPKCSRYYLQFGPCRSLQMIHIDQNSANYQIVQSNQLMLGVFAEKVIYLLSNYQEQSDQIKLNKPKIICNVIGSMILDGQDIKKQHLMNMIKQKVMLKLNSKISENKKRFISLHSPGAASDVISQYIFDIFSSGNVYSVRSPIFSVMGEENKLITIYGTVDGKIFTQYGNQQKFVTARHPFNLLDTEWILPDPIVSMEFITQIRILITGHASGYIRFYTVNNLGDLKMINRIKVSDLPILNICASPDSSAMMVADSSYECYYLSGVQKDSMVLGHFNVTKLPNLAPFDQSQFLAAASLSYARYVEQAMSKILYSAEELNKQLQDQQETEKLKLNLQKYQIITAKKSEDLGAPAKAILQNEQKPDQLEKLIQAIKPIQNVFQDKFLLNHLNHIRKISCSRESFFVALSNGDIVKLAYPSNDRVMQANDQGLVILGSEFVAKIGQSTEYELQQYENKFYQINKTQQIDPSELSPMIIHTGQAISTIYVDQCIVPPPCQIADFIYTGLMDGRVLIYQYKSQHEKITIQIQSVIKNELPMLPSFIQMSSAIDAIKIVNNILMISDSKNIVLTNPALPNAVFLKKTGQQLLKNDDLVPVLPAQEVSAPNVDLQKPLAGAIRQFISQQYCIFDVPCQKHTQLLGNQLSIVTFKGEFFQIEISQETLNSIIEQSSQMETVSKQFVTSSLQQTGLDTNLQAKQVLKQNYEMRQSNRQFQLSLQEQQTTIQLIQTISQFSDSAISLQHPFCSHLTQHMVKRMTIEANELFEGNQLMQPQKVNLMEHQTEDNASIIEQQKKQSLSKIALEPIPCGIECSYQQCSRLAAIIVTSQLRIKTNVTLFEETAKLCKMTKDLEKQNQQILNERGLQVLPNNTTLTFLKSQQKNEITGKEEYQFNDIPKLLAATARLNEKDLRISSEVANTARYNLLFKAADYEKQFKKDLVTAKAYLHELQVDRIQTAEIGQVGEGVCGLQNKQNFVSSIPVPKNADQIIKRAKKMALLRSAQMVSERMAPYLPPALVKTSQGKWVLPDESQLQKQKMEQQTTFSKLQPNEPFDEKILDEAPPNPEDPFAISSHETGVPSGTLIKILNLSTPLSVRTLTIPNLPPQSYKLQENQKLSQLIENVPQIKRFHIPSISLRKACFNETDLVYGVRAMQQLHIYKALTILLVKDTNTKISKIKDLKFRTLQKIQEIAQQVKDIGKELTYHAREQTMTEMIETQRKKLFAEAIQSGVAQEECAERAAKNAAAMINEDDVAERAISLLPMELLDANTIAGYSGSDKVDKTESLVQALGFNPYGVEQDKKNEKFVNELRKVAQQCTLEKFSILIKDFLAEIKSNECQNQQVIQAFRALSDEGLFSVQNLDQYFIKTEQKINNTNQAVAPEVLQMATAYKRALYEMMRGSIDASNKQSIRDITIPPFFGLQGRQNVKLNKEQEAQLELYTTKLKEIEENRIKEQKRLHAMLTKLRESAQELSINFDSQTLKQLKEKRFNAEIKIQAFQLNNCFTMNSSLIRQKQLQLINEKQSMFSQFDKLKTHFIGYKQFIDEIRTAMRDKLNQIQEMMTFFMNNIDKAQLDQKMKDLLKKNTSVPAFIANLRQTLHSENRVKIQQQIQGQFSSQYQQFKKVIDDFFLPFYPDNTGAMFREVHENSKNIYENFFSRLSQLNTFDAQSFTSHFNDMVFPDGIYPDMFLKKQSNAGKALQNPMFAQIPYFILFQKLIPLESVAEFTELKLQQKNASQLQQTFDVFRCFKTVTSIYQFQLNQKMIQLDDFEKQLSKQQQELDECTKYDYNSDIENLKKTFANAVQLILLKEGQVEYPRPFEALNDQLLIKYEVDQDGNITKHTEPNQYEVDENTDIIMRDDTQFIILNQDFVQNQLNATLKFKGQELKHKLEDIARVHQRINILQKQIALAEQRTIDFHAQTKDFQMIRVSKEMLDIIRTNTSTENRKAQEVKTIMTKLEHSRKAQLTSIKDKETTIQKVPFERQQIEIQNKILQQKIEEIEAKNIQREQAIPDFETDEADQLIGEEFGLDMLTKKYLTQTKLQKTLEITNQEETDKKFRRIAALRKMRELSKAQEEEMQFLIQELDKLRKKTYPSFE